MEAAPNPNPPNPAVAVACVEAAGAGAPNSEGAGAAAGLAKENAIPHTQRLHARQCRVPLVANCWARCYCWVCTAAVTLCWQFGAL